jgi:hypothetical protein
MKVIRFSDLENEFPIVTEFPKGKIYSKEKLSKFDFDNISDISSGQLVDPFIMPSGTIIGICDDSSIIEAEIKHIFVSSDEFLVYSDPDSRAGGLTTDDAIFIQVSDKSFLSKGESIDVIYNDYDMGEDYENADDMKRIVNTYGLNYLI